MSDYLIEHALDNVWCTPDQDYQYIYRMAHITGKFGVSRTVDVEWQTIHLPNRKDDFNVYWIGQIHPKLLGLINSWKTWTPFSTVCEQAKMIVDLYNVDGVQIPRHMAYLQVMGDRNIVIAIKRNEIFGSLYHNPLYFRVYSNAFFASERSYKDVNMVKINGYTYDDDRAKLLTFQREYLAWKAKLGHTYAYINGYLVDDFQPDRVIPGDIVEYVYDSTIRRVVDLPLKNLSTFVSLVDNKRKYLLHYVDDQKVTIDYRDDIDIYLIKKETNGRYRGIYHHKNQPDSLRMVTHKDYAIVVPYVAGFVAATEGWHDLAEITVRLCIREAGWKRPLVDENSRIKELYKLKVKDIPKAMLGLESTVAVWRADNLEAAMYPKVMGARGPDITRKMVQDAYGYNAISKLVADTPQKVTVLPRDRFAEMPIGLQTDATCYEHDANGVLMGYYPHTSGKFYSPRNEACRLIEALVGIGSNVLDTIYHQLRSPLNPTYNYRFYKCSMVAGTPSFEWVTATPNVDYVIANDEVVWTLDRVRWYTAVRDDRKFLAFNLSITAPDGLYYFPIKVTEKRTDGNYYEQPMNLPMGKLELFLNGHPLIEGLDYFLNWPYVTLTNREFLVESGPQQIFGRATGFPQDDLTLEAPAEFGFVQNGLLSRNRRFDIRDDKVMRMIVRGRTLTRDKLKFAEDHSGVYLTTEVKNGSPYQIDDVVVPLRGLVDENTYSLRAKSKVTDQAISDYLTLKLPEPVISNPNMIEERYEVFSPFACKVMFDLMSGLIWDDQMKAYYGDPDIKRWLKDYEYLLDFDPCKRDVDTRYVSIHPHHLSYETELDIYQYNFLKRAIAFYLEGKVDLSHFVSIKDGWV
ncbi:hypothetical protein D3C71_376510 [compost metagenome]